MSARDQFPKAAAFADMQGNSLTRWGQVAAALNLIDDQAAELDRLRAERAQLEQRLAVLERRVNRMAQAVGE